MQELEYLEHMGDVDDQSIFVGILNFPESLDQQFIREMCDRFWNCYRDGFEDSPGVHIGEKINLTGDRPAVRVMVDRRDVKGLDLYEAHNAGHRFCAVAWVKTVTLGGITSQRICDIKIIEQDGKMEKGWLVICPHCGQPGDHTGMEYSAWNNRCGWL